MTGSSTQGLAVRCKAFLFDWDGTLLDSLPLKVENAVRLFATHYGVAPEAVRASYRRHSGMPRRELFDRIAVECTGHRLSDQRFEALSRAFSEANLRTITAKGVLRPNVRSSLEALRQRNCLLFVSTSASQQELALLVRHFGLDTYFEELLGSRPGFSKGLEHVAHVSATYHLCYEEMAGVGDEPHDIRLHRAAGITAIGITGTEERETLLAAGADLVIDDLAELVAYVG